MKRCEKCGVDKTFFEFYKESRNRDKMSSHCKSCQRHNRRKWDKEFYKRHRVNILNRIHARKKNNPILFKSYQHKSYIKRKEKIKQYNATPRGRYMIYRRGAKIRKIDFLLNENQFTSFYNKNCYYCNEKINGVGIDRKDNNIGYIIENCVPCCYTCNVMKLKLDSSSFINQCKKITNNFVR